MKNTPTPEMVDESLAKMVHATHEHFGNYAFATGYLSSTLSAIIAEMKPKDRQRYINIFELCRKQYSQPKVKI